MCDRRCRRGGAGVGDRLLTPHPCPVARAVSIALPLIYRFFSKKIGYVPEQDPSLPYVRPSFKDAGVFAVCVCE